MQSKWCGIIVAALGFWGVVDAEESWSLAVVDVGWVLCCIMEFMDTLTDC